MLSRLLNGPKIRRRSAAGRPSPKALRPLLESMEDRRLLSTTPPLMLIGDAGVIEGTGGLTPMNFTVSLSHPTGNAVTVNYRTFDFTAKAGSDYIAAAGQLTFAPGETSKPITVQVIGDSEVEPTETFFVSLFGATNARVIKAIAVGTIVDDDAAVAPELSINNVVTTKDHEGYHYMTFAVTLNTSVAEPVSVTASTRNVTAAAGRDYEATAEILAFAPGERTREFRVKIFGSTEYNPDRLFYVDLTGASVAVRVAVGAGIIKSAY